MSATCNLFPPDAWDLWPSYLLHSHYLPSHSVISDSLQPHRLQHDRLLCPWDSPGKNIGVGFHALLQGIFLTQVLNPSPLLW